MKKERKKTGGSSINNRSENRIGLKIIIGTRAKTIRMAWLMTCCIPLSI
jgi:hypothetical protein